MQPGPIEAGANCQRYAYAVLGLFDRHVPGHRSSELWDDQAFIHPPINNLHDLDLVLFNANNSAWAPTSQCQWMVSSSISVPRSAILPSGAGTSSRRDLSTPQSLVLFGSLRRGSRPGASEDHR